MKKVRLHKQPDNALHPVDDCVVLYIRRDTSVTNELFWTNQTTSVLFLVIKEDTQWLIG